MRLANKVALVTGAGSGFGEAIAKTFAREDARVGAADINEGAAKKVAAAIGPSAIAVGCNVSKRPDVDANAALFFASDEAAFLTGVVVEIDGGRSV